VFLLTAEKKHDLKAMQKAVTSETKIITITNPNNPTATLVSNEEIG
jgi:histidinol-phosphate aminotransferase